MTRMPHSFSHSRVMTIARPKEWMRVPSGTLASSKASKRRMLRRRENNYNIAMFWMMCCTFFLEHASTGEAMRRRRRGLIPRERLAWKRFIRPIVEDGSFRLPYRMSYRDFKDLYTMLRKHLEKHDGSGVGRNGTVAGEWALAGTLRYLAGGSIYEVMDGAHIARSTAYANIQLGLGAILGCKRLRVKFPQTQQELKEAALGFRCRSSQDVIRNCVSAGDGLFVRRRKPTKGEHAAPERFYSGHKKAVGMNTQVSLRYTAMNRSVHGARRAME